MNKKRLQKMTLEKSEYIKTYGEVAWQKELERNREWKNAHREEMNAGRRGKSEANPEKVEAANHEINRKGGKYYDKKIEYNKTGIPGNRHKIRTKHARQYKPYKAIVAPESQLHHEWIPETAEYRGVALVEREAHQYGIVDVIEILDGKISLRTEEEVRNGKKNGEMKK